MKKLILLSYSLLAIATFCRAQEAGLRAHEEEVRLEKQDRKIVVSYKKNAQGDYEFICENKTFCYYIVEVNFTQLENLQTDAPLPLRVTVPPGVQRIVTLKKIISGDLDRGGPANPYANNSGAVLPGRSKNNQPTPKKTTPDPPTHVSYRYKFFKGCDNPVVDTGFAYLLPLAPGKETRIEEVPYSGTKIGESEPKDWYMLDLHVHEGDTIFAARSGRVTDSREQPDQQDSASANQANFVEIGHDNCSFARYELFRNNTVFVHPGDMVKAGQPLGIAGSSRIRFLVYYHLDQEVTFNGEKTAKTYHWGYVPMQFWVKDKGKTRLSNHASYTSEHPTELIAQK